MRDRAVTAWLRQTWCSVQLAGGSKPGRRNGFSAAFRKLSSIDRELWLASDQCQELVDAGKLQKTQVEAERRRLQRETAIVRPKVPSPARLDEFRRGYPFPPPAEHTPMRRADIVLDRATELTVYWPASYLSEVAGGVAGGQLPVATARATYDVVCAQTESLQKKLGLGAYDRSSSAAAIDKLAATGGTIKPQVELLTEDENVLRRQIERYLQGKRTTLIQVGPARAASYVVTELLENPAENVPPPALT